MTPPTSFETSRLILRAAQREHAASLFEEYTGRNDAARYLLRRAHPSTARTEAIIETNGQVNWLVTNRFAWTILRRSDEQIVGMIQLFVEGEGAEIHYGIGPNYWGHGFATEAGSAVMDWVVTKSPITKVSTCCAAEHSASLRVLEKIGLTRVELLPAHLLLPSVGHRVDGWLYCWNRYPNQSRVSQKF